MVKQKYMTRNKKIILGITVGIIIFLFGSLLYTGLVIKEKSGTPSINIPSAPEISYAPNEWKTWEDNYYSKTTGENFSYKLRYPRDFDVLQGDSASGGLIGNPAVQLAFPEDAFQTPRTNYGGAYLTISIGTDKPSLDNCYKRPSRMKLLGAKAKLSDTQVINGRIFYTDTFKDFAAGSIFDSRIYRILVDGRCFEVAQTIHTGNISNYPAGTATKFDQSKAMNILNQMLGTLTIETVQPISGVVLTGKIAACYPKNENCSACQLILNNSVQQIVETSRRFVNVPKDFYPKEIGSYFTTVSGNATAGFIGSGGLPGEGVNTTPDCWSTYFEFDGNGEVDLRVKSTKKGVPDYFVRFIVGPTQ